MLDGEEKQAIAYRQEILDLTRTVEDLNARHERQLKMFDDTIKKLETEKYFLIDEIKSKHKQEIESLKQSLNSNKDTLLTEKQKIEEKYEQEIAKLKTDLEALSTKSAKEKHEFEQNILKLKAFHEKELEAHKQNSSNEYLKLIGNLKSDLENLAKSKCAMEKDLTDRYNSKLEEVMQREEEIKNLNEYVEKLQATIRSSTVNSSTLNDKVRIYLIVIPLIHLKII